MSTPLITNATGHIVTTGFPPENGPHCIDVFPSSGALFLKITLDGRNPGGGLREVDLRLDRQQAKELIDGLTQGLLSI
jgi:hypothetical protein